MIRLAEARKQRMHRSKAATGRVGRSLLGIVLLLAPLQTGCAARTGEIDGVSEDQRITAEVQRILVEDEHIVAEDLEVETSAGVVVITGVQTDLEAVSELLSRVARVRGVAEVVNRIRILR